ncbi:MAG: MBL fold metallo-hydrolase [Chloroflexi bacterium]|nr:MBL fold metallo-hydrolase [Chloroflexota bacterium]
MRLEFWGAAQTVTGSMHVLRVNGSMILLDCGLFQGRRQESYERNLNFPFSPKALEGLILSHAHMDHSGNLPNLVKQGYTGPVFATNGTRDLCAAMLADSGKIHESDAQYVNKKRAQQNLPPIEPLYTLQDAVNCMNSFVASGYDRQFAVGPGIKAIFRDAGHILGSAGMEVEIQEGARTVRLGFSGDIGRKGMAILRDPQPVRDVDVLIMESTYGDRLHETPEQAMDKLRNLINQVVARRGKIVIPAFAVGRTQEIVYELHQLALKGGIPHIPIFVDSPLALGVTEVYRIHPECYDAETRQFLLENHEQDLFGFKNMQYVRSTEESKALNAMEGPMVIISASGMAEAGRVLHHLKNTITDPRNAVLIVGWQAPNTLGRKLMDREHRVKIFGEEYPLRAQVEVIHGYSAHADRGDLIDYARQVQQGGRLHKVFLVHGEPEPARALVPALKKLGLTVYYPANGEGFEV